MTAIIVFAIAAALIVYILAGYPILLYILARTRPWPIAKAFQQRPVSAVIAVHNGESYIEDKLRSLLALEYPRELLEILVVSDESTDRTDEIVRGFEGDGVRLLRVPRGGKCAALNAGIPQTRGEILLLTDVRQTVAPDSLQLLVNCFADPTVSAVSGELVIRQGNSLEEIDTGAYWRFETWIRNQLSSIDSIFGATGPFYAIRREAVVPVPQDILLDDVYLPLAGFFRGYRLVVEAGAKAYDYPTSRQSEFGRKVRTLGGNYQIIRTYPVLTLRNRMLLHFVSYKLGRLLLPWLLLVFLAASFFVPAPLRNLALAAQALFYGLALLDPLFPARFPLKRLSSPIRTFLTLMVAALAGLAVFFVEPRKLWRKTVTAAEAKG